MINFKNIFNVDNIKKVFDSEIMGYIAVAFIGCLLLGLFYIGATEKPTVTHETLIADRLFLSNPNSFICISEKDHKIEICKVNLNHYEIKTDLNKNDKIYLEVTYETYHIAGEPNSHGFIHVHSINDLGAGPWETHFNKSTQQGFNVELK